MSVKTSTRAVDSFSKATTSVEVCHSVQQSDTKVGRKVFQLLCPEDTTGIERIMLAAQGDLQRLLSCFFARPISIECVSARTSPRSAPASPQTPITQNREVHEHCSNRVVCVATSVVTLTSPETERLLLDEKFAIGQLFRHMRVSPRFTLLNVQTRNVKGRRELERTYKLEAEGICCEITEVFPDRDMFVLGQAWLDGRASVQESVMEKTKSEVKVDASVPVTAQGFLALMFLSFIFGSYAVSRAALYGIAV
ncbi:hypothetical protein NEOLEDRAFT_1074735 [Neolentinus lepideus HHB14362 ss-1]|uniref:Uncharacterized protein n=1 Tax=Neolentinus lepideus HHB14362 ss-1 TaxID=1314782 RepID=A0A165PCL1_9AGAM|nr:hypothetical protein NEOLEDRAFT_1074735 [Neolentinus lepideus HHB14362 ss-1]